MAYGFQSSQNQYPSKHHFLIACKRYVTDIMQIYVYVYHIILFCIPGTHKI